MYKLFIGFRKLGEFGSILAAKQYARDSGYSGMFNLMGDNYRDSWYVFPFEIKNKENQPIKTKEE